MTDIKEIHATVKLIGEKDTIFIEAWQKIDLVCDLRTGAALLLRRLSDRVQNETGAL